MNDREVAPLFPVVQMAIDKLTRQRVGLREDLACGRELLQKATDLRSENELTYAECKEKITGYSVVPAPPFTRSCKIGLPVSGLGVAEPMSPSVFVTLTSLPLALVHNQGRPALSDNKIVFDKPSRTSAKRGLAFFCKMPKA